MEQLTPILISLAIAIISYLTAYFTNLKLKKKISTLEDFIASDDAEYYVECPNCKSKIILSKVKILINKQ